MKARDTFLFSESAVQQRVMAAGVVESSYRSPVDHVLSFTHLLSAGAWGMVLGQVCLQVCQAGLKQEGEEGRTLEIGQSGDGAQLKQN